MLFGIGLCQIFDDPDLGQQADREPAAALFGRTAWPVCAARTHLHARPLALSPNFKHAAMPEFCAKLCVALLTHLCTFYMLD